MKMCCTCVVSGGHGDMVEPVLQESAGEPERTLLSDGVGESGGDIKCSGLGAGAGFITAPLPLELAVDDGQIICLGLSGLSLRIIKGLAGMVTEAASFSLFALSAAADCSGLRKPITVGTVLRAKPFTKDCWTPPWPLAEPFEPLTANGDWRPLL